jgi:hypothetical protein
MRCSCCGKRKRLLGVFENLGKGGDVCLECSDILYRIQYAFTEKNKEEYDRYVHEIEGKDEKASADFKNWFKNDFMKRNAFREIERGQKNLINPANKNS